MANISRLELLVHRTNLLNVWRALTSHRFAYSMILPTEATAVAVIMEYWTTAVPSAVWITIIIVGKLI